MRTASGDPKLTRVLQSEMELDNVKCLNEYNSDNRFSKGFETENLVCATPLIWVNTTNTVSFRNAYFAEFAAEVVDDCDLGLCFQGGPLQMAAKNKDKLWTQIGISSVLPNPSYRGISNGPMVYVRVAYYVDWISNIVWV